MIQRSCSAVPGLGAARRSACCFIALEVLAGYSVAGEDASVPARATLSPLTHLQNSSNKIAQRSRSCWRSCDTTRPASRSSEYPSLPTCARVNRVASTPNLSNTSSGSTPFTFVFDMRWPCLSRIVPVTNTSSNGFPAHKLYAHHHHARNPQKDDVARSHEHGRGVESFEVVGFIRPAKSGKRPERRREPRVEYIWILSELILPAFSRASFRSSDKYLPSSVYHAGI